MSYINQYNDAGTLYDLQDIRIGEHLDSAAGKPLVAAVGGGFQLADAVATKSTGNLSLMSTLAPYSLGGGLDAKPWSKVYLWNNKLWGARLVNNNAGDVVVCDNDCIFNTSKTGIDTGENFYDIASNNNILIATTYSNNTSGATNIYYYQSGEWSSVSFDSGIVIPSGTKLDLVEGGGQFIAVPHGINDWVLYSKNGKSWTKLTFGSAATDSGPVPQSNIFYHNGFKYERMSGMAQKFYCLGEDLIWHDSEQYMLYLTPTNVYCKQVNGLIYEYAEVGENLYILSGSSVANFNLIASYSSLPVTFANIKFFTIISNDLIIWDGTNALTVSDLSNTTPAFTTRQFMFEGSAVIPEMVCEINGTLYASEPSATHKLFTNAKRGAADAWKNGELQYTISQSNDGDDNDITRILLNLVKKDSNTYQLSAGQVGAIPAPSNPSDGATLVYDAATDTWNASNAPVYIKDFTNNTVWIDDTNFSYITVTAATHDRGINPQVEIYHTDQSGNFHKYYGFPSTGWEVIISTIGDVTLKVYDSAKFNGRIVIR